MCIIDDYKTIEKSVQADLWHNQLEKQVYTRGGAGQDASAIEAIERAWWVILTGCFTALLFAAIYMYLMAYFPTYIAYTAIGFINLIWLSGFASGIYLGVKVDGSNGWVLSIVMLIFALTMDLLLWCYWPLFKQAIAIVDATAHFFISTKRILLVSLVFFVIEFAVFVGAMVYLVCLYGNLDVIPDLNSANLQGKIYQDNNNFASLAFLLLFAYLWLNNYVGYQAVMTCMCSVSTYYFNSNSDGEGSAEVAQALYWSNVTHAGSVALGSLLMALINLM